MQVLNSNQAHIKTMNDTVAGMDNQNNFKIRLYFYIYISRERERDRVPLSGINNHLIILC